MFQLSKWLVGLSLILGVTSVHSFSLLGPYDSWQTPEIGYNRGGDIGGPMNLGEEYRWNVPTITYAFDATFVEYFGTNGMAAVDQAMKILNDLPPASRLDPNEFLLNTVSSNPQAAGLSLFDLKSTALTFLVEELGLAEPERWTYALRRRDVIGTPAITNYLVIQRNFDPVTYRPTNVVNGVSFNYIVFDPAYINPDGADAVEIPFTTTAVAGFAGFGSGDFLFGLTRDDVGGLKYLYKPTTLNVETLPANTFLSTRVGLAS